MLNITLTSEAAARLREIIEEEGEDACIRVRETKVGAGWKSHIELRLSIDEREDEDAEAEMESLRFVINQEIIDQYGEAFSVSLDENKMPVVVAQNWRGPSQPVHERTLRGPRKQTSVARRVDLPVKRAIMVCLTGR